MFFSTNISPYLYLLSKVEALGFLLEVTMTGTHRGQPKVREAFSGMLNDVAPTGKSVKVLQFHSFRVRDGLIAEHAAVRDDMAMVQQLGLVKKP